MRSGIDFNAGPSFGSYRLTKKCFVKIPLFEDIVIVIMGDLATTATKLNEQELKSAELEVLNFLSLDCLTDQGPCHSVASYWDKF